MDEITKDELDARLDEQKQEIEEFKSTEKPLEPKVFMRGNRVFLHTVFKLDVEMMKKNTAWKPGVVNIEDIEHCHFFHDRDRKGKNQERSTPTGGHFHNMVTQDENGNLLMDDEGFAKPKAGPPLQVRMVRNRRGKLVKKVVSVKWYSDQKDADEVDEHTHTVTNLGSEELSPNKIKQIQQANQAGIAALAKQ